MTVKGRKRGNEISLLEVDNAESSRSDRERRHTEAVVLELGSEAVETFEDGNDTDKDERNPSVCDLTEPSAFTGTSVHERIDQQ